MSTGHFLHCRECDELFRPSPYDRTPEFRLGPEGWIESTRDDCMAFLARHARHPLQTLRPAGQAAAHDGPLWDPMVTTFWEVSNGAERFVVQGWREHVGEPLRYRLLAGRLVAERVAIEIPEEDLRAQVDEALYPGVVPERKLRTFVDAFKAIVWDLDPCALEILYDAPNEPALSVARLPEAALRRVRERMATIFDAADCARLERWLGVASDEPDALAVLVRRQIRIEPMPERAAAT